MCTTDCICYKGPGGSTKRQWEKLGEERLAKYNRTIHPGMYFTGENNDIALYPLKWTNN